MNSARNPPVKVLLVQLALLTGGIYHPLDDRQHILRRDIGIRLLAQIRAAEDVEQD